jgi:hypothetical protein
MPNTPCNFQRFCVSKFACPNSFNKVFILFKCAHALCGMNPTPHAEIPMMPNNILKAKHTNKGCLTCGICYVWAWSSSHSNFIFFFTRSKAFFSFCFCLACKSFKIWAFVRLWSCCLSPLRWEDGCLDFLAYIRRECVCSKCWWSNHLAT